MKTSNCTADIYNEMFSLAQEIEFVNWILMPPWEENMTDKRKNSKSSSKNGITHSYEEASIDDGEGSLIHPANVCAVLSRNEQLTSRSTGRLVRWKISQSWIKSLTKTDQTLDLVKPGSMFIVATESGLEFIKVLVCIELTGSKFFSH